MVAPFEIYLKCQLCNGEKSPIPHWGSPFPIGDGDGDAIVTPDGNGDGDGDNYLTSGMGMVSTIPRIPGPVAISTDYIWNFSVSRYHP